MSYRPLRLACFLAATLASAASATGIPPLTIDQAAKEYVTLVLAMGEHDPAYVDAYYGPTAWRDAVRSDTPDTATIAQRAAGLKANLEIPEGAGEMEQLRVDYLRTQLGALAAYAAMQDADTTPDFDQQAQALYDTTPPHRSLASFDATLEQLDQLLPGEGPLYERVDRFYQGYEIPADRLAAVFEAAIAACKERTLQHIQLPEGESFRLEYVTGKPWSGYNWYKGNAHSLIQLNTELPVRIDRAIDIGCHEGYPGHHTYNALLESEFVRRRGWVEFSVYPLFSPQSLIAEGSANYGIELAFPEPEKLAFEQKVLYPLAGLDPASAERYEQVSALTRELSFARNEIARQYIDGDIDRARAVELSQVYGVTSRERAEQSVKFIDTYGAYVINYNWGRALVQDYIERDTPDHAERWRRFASLLASPRLPSDLQ
jgi:hypothetical protein